MKVELVCNGVLVLQQLDLKSKFWNWDVTIVPEMNWAGYVGHWCCSGGGEILPIISSSSLEVKSKLGETEIGVGELVEYEIGGDGEIRT